MQKFTFNSHATLYCVSWNFHLEYEIRVTLCCACLSALRAFQNVECGTEPLLDVPVLVLTALFYLDLCFSAASYHVSGPTVVIVVAELCRTTSCFNSCDGVLHVIITQHEIVSFRMFALTLYVIAPRLRLASCCVGNQHKSSYLLYLCHL